MLLQQISSIQFIMILWMNKFTVFSAKEYIIQPVMSCLIHKKKKTFLSTVCATKLILHDIL